MADGVAITAGSGTTIATDDVGGVQYQRIKRSVGADGSATDFLDKHSASHTVTTAAAQATQNVSAQGMSRFALQVKQTGTVTSWTVALEVSLDGTNFVALPEMTQTKATNGDGAITWSGSLTFPALYFRANVTALTLGGGTNIVVTVLGLP
jgi:hypothetical protein